MPASRDGRLNVKGGALAPCSEEPLTGFYRNGCCDTGPDDMGMHTVCAVMTEAFLVYSKLAGNDLSTPRPDLGSRPARGRSLVPVRRRWREALAAGVAPPVVLERRTRKRSPSCRSTTSSGTRRDRGQRMSR
jgi:uncharacterized protein (DUF2237 family)